MQIKNTDIKKQKRKPYIWWVAIGILLAFVLLSFYRWTQLRQVKQTYFCDMEKRSLSQRKFLSQGNEFTGGLTQSDIKAFSGSYSSRCDAENIYGPGIQLNGLNEGDVIEASIWRQSDEGYGVLAFQGMDGWPYYKTATEVVETRKGWERIQNTIRIPIGMRNASLNIYPYNAKKEGVVYFDDLLIHYWPSDTFSLQAPKEYAGANLKLQVDKKELKQLRTKRVEAFSYGNLLSDKDDLVRAKLLDDSSEIAVKIRLKGDLLDHLESKKWSFRIIADKGQAWKGMTEFSVHNSLSRSHLNEWIYHQLLAEEGIMTTRYDFTKLSLNDEVLGIYAYEEHFGYGLIRHQQRPPGPILRFNEDGLWTYAPRGIGVRPDWFESADIGLYDSKEVLGKQESYEQFIRAQDLLYAFIKGEKSPEEVFDTERLARFLALQDACIAHHSFIFTNVRFYFNPLTGLLEPIGYDGYTDDMTRHHQSPVIAGASINTRTPKYYATNTEYAHFHKLLFTDYAFSEKYIHYLAKFTSEAYQEAFLKKYIQDIRAREKFIQRDYIDYKFDPDFYFRNANTIRKVLPPLEHTSLKAYLSSNGVILESYHVLPLQILGAGDKEMTIPAPEDLILESYNPLLAARRYEFPFSGKAKNIFFKTLGTDSIAVQPINRWEIPKLPAAPRLAPNFQQFNFIRQEVDGTLTVQPGTHKLNKTLTIPKGYRLIIPPGVTFQLETGASICSHSPVQAIGTMDKPIIFISESGTGQGLFLVETKAEASNFQHCVFSNLQAFRQGGQYTEGAVSLYESKAIFRNCVFSKIQAKNALHLVQSLYTIEDSKIQETNGDGIDADYSEGSINKVTFTQIGQDAIEISGGTASIEGATILDVLGSGIQANLQSVVSGGTIVIKSSKAGVTAQDRAKVTFKKVVLEKLTQGFVAYQKLADYGGGEIRVAEYTETEVGELFVKDGPSFIQLRNTKK